MRINLDKIKSWGIGILLAIVAGFAAWLTHIIHCLQNDQWGFLIAGAIAFPIGIIHGLGLWVGLF
jgi:hypothetical protein